jgi:carboxyl-terminal processing protease
VKGYILDVRGTRYGNILLVQRILSRFVNGQNLVYLLSRDQQGMREIVAMPGGTNVKLVDKPVAVLVDQGTSNEAEIFAQAIKNKKRGGIFGVGTAGCLIASAPTLLADKSVLNIATYRSVANSNDPNSLIESVDPDEIVELDPRTLSQGQDAQLEKAVAYIKSH